MTSDFFFVYFFILLQSILVKYVNCILFLQNVASYINESQFVFFSTKLKFE